MNNETGTQANPENRAAPTWDDVEKMKAEVDRLQQQLQAYTAAVGSKVDSIEDGMERLITENERLIALRQSAEVERDAVVALAAELALAAGMNAGNVDNAIVAIDLPSGQVSWEIASSEAHLIAKLPRYENELENLEISDKYDRVMNSGVRSGGNA